ncbi:hypothetical protein GY45DRAFT_1369722 [Cubamyces sp. BRFM 1775]|nr:hypothetical protein GY45DRAFT_1369722 [Cubamyces sp. BRFM 1775]
MATLPVVLRRRRLGPRGSTLNVTLAPFHSGKGQSGHNGKGDDFTESGPQTGHSSGSGGDGGNSGGEGDSGKGDNGSDNGGDGGGGNQNNGNGHPKPYESTCGAAPKPLIPGVQCTFVDENDGRLKYGPGWTLVPSNTLFGTQQTVHIATTNGSSVSIEFDGTSILVFGSVPQSNMTTAPPSAAYSVDGEEPWELPLPIADRCIPNQQFFHSRELTLGTHNLTINVTTPDSTPYILDYLWFCTDKPAQTSNSTGLKTEKPSHETFSHLDGIVLGSVFGGVFFLLAVAALAWMLTKARRRRRKLRKLHIAASPVSSWLNWNSRSGRSNNTEVAFTSTESIMRDNSSDASAGDPDDFAKRRRMISMPISTLLPPEEPALPPGLASSRPISYVTVRPGERALSPPPWTIRSRS